MPKYLVEAWYTAYMQVEVEAEDDMDARYSGLDILNQRSLNDADSIDLADEEVTLVGEE